MELVGYHLIGEEKKYDAADNKGSKVTFLKKQKTDKETYSSLYSRKGDMVYCQLCGVGRKLDSNNFGNFKVSLCNVYLKFNTFQLHLKECHFDMLTAEDQSNLGKKRECCVANIFEQSKSKRRKEVKNELAKFTFLFTF